MPSNYITLPRSQFYELVWSKPVTEISAQFGISDVARAKRCRALNIPLPLRGYWAKVQAGQSPRRTLPPFRDLRKTSPRAQPSRSAASQRDRPHQPDGAASPSLPSYASASAGQEPVITFAPPPAPKPKDSTTLISPEEAALRARIDALDLTPTTDLTTAHPAVLRTAVYLKRLKSRDLTWPRGERTGPILELRNVSDGQQVRALTALDALLRGAEQLGWSFDLPPPDPNADRRQSDHVPTETEKADQKLGRHVWMPRFDYAPSGELRLRVTEPDRSYTDRVFKDSKRRPLELQARTILHGLLDLALARQRHREEQRLRAIAEREAERQREIILQHRAATAKLIHTLEAQAGAWARAQFLRRYLRAARRSLGDRALTANLQRASIEFLAWAERYVNQLDPLHAEPRNPDCTHEHSWQYNSEEKRFAEELQRLLGHGWEHAAKLS